MGSRHSERGWSRISATGSQPLARASCVSCGTTLGKCRGIFGLQGYMHHRSRTWLALLLRGLVLGAAGESDSVYAGKKAAIVKAR